jgi:CHAT domain-containing protein
MINDEVHVDSLELLGRVEHLYQYDEAESLCFDTVGALKLYDECGYEAIADLSNIEPELVSDLFFFVGCELNQAPEKWPEAQRLLSAAVEIRTEVFGDGSIFTKAAELFLAENHFLCSDFQKAAELSLRARSCNDADAAYMRCYAAYILARINLSGGVKIKEAFEYLMSAKKELEEIPKAHALYDTLYFFLYSLIASFYDEFSDIDPYDFLSKSELKDMLFMLVEGMPELFDRIISQEDPYTIMKESLKAGIIVDLIATMSYDKQIDCTDAEVYAVVTSGKSMLTRLLREKKRRRSLHPENEEQYNRIDEFARRLAQHNTEMLFRNSEVDFGALCKEKSILELDVQSRGDGSGNELLRFEDICEKLPDGCILVDYYCHSKNTRSPKYLGDMRYSVFILYRDHGNVTVKRLPYLNVLEVRRWILLITASMRATRNLWLTPYLASSAGAFLNSLLIEPIKRFLDDNVKTIIVSPDFDICMLPLPAIDAGGECLISKYNIMYIDSGRDLHGDIWVDMKGKEALVIGNPAFTIDKTNVQPAPVEKFNSGALPLSKVEAMLVAEKLSTSPHMLQNASKRLLESTKADIIHIATHGILLGVENDGDEFAIDPLRRSCLFFSGVNDWLETGALDPRYGNGILTAEEVYLADMKPPELVALSACFSASGEQNIGGGVIGLRTAFKANGAKAMLLSIWEADDFTSAVLVDRFYDNLSCMPAAAALRNAQLYVRDVTISELKKKMWFDESRLRRIGYSADSLRELSQKGDNTKPFMHPKYWSGFVLIQ